MTQQGHNSGKLKKLAEKAREGLDKVFGGNDQIEEGLKQVSEGEDKTIEGWLIYGAAINEGRAMFPKGDNKRFSEWLARNNLSQADRPDRSAAMWAAANPEEFEATREAYPRVRTVRGLHAKWRKEQNAKEKPDEEPDDDEDVVDNDDTDDGDETNEDTPDTGKGKPKKAKPINSPPYSIQEAVGAIQSLSQVYVREYTGTDEEAADILFSEIVKGCEQGSINMSISRDRIKWVLKWKKMLDLAEPRMREFLKEEPKLNVVK